MTTTFVGSNLIFYVLFLAFAFFFLSSFLPLLFHFHALETNNNEFVFLHFLR